MTTIYHTDAERLTYATSLFQVALTSHASSPTATKRSLLFLYLFGWRYISRRQIYTLTGYHPSSEKKNAEEFIGKFVRADLIRRCSSETGIADDSLYTPTKKGISLGKEFFLSEVTRILSTKDVFYYRYVNELLLGNPDNLSPYADAFADYTTARYKNKLRQSLHRVAAMDSCITFLRHLSPATLLSFSTEVSLFRGEVCDTTATHLSAEADVRSDAVFFLSPSRTGLMQAPDKNSPLVCIEQDTSRQSAAILSDKIARYINLVVLPRYRNDLPAPTLIFSVLPANRPGKIKAVSTFHPGDKEYVEDIMRFSILYCNHIGSDPERITLSDFLTGFPAFCENNQLFSRHLRFLTEHVSDYGAHLPIAKLLDRYQELVALNPAEEHANRKLTASFQRRKQTIWSAIECTENLETVAATGFSLCISNNYTPAGLLTFFPELCCGRELLYQVIGKDVSITSFSPFYTYRCEDGTEITFRNAYHVGNRVYVMENIADDYFGQMRLNMLLAHDAEPGITFLAIFPVEEYVRLTKWMHDISTCLQRKVLFGCGYRKKGDEGIFFVAPISITTLPL